MKILLVVVSSPGAPPVQGGWPPADAVGTATGWPPPTPETPAASSWPRADEVWPPAGPPPETGQTGPVAGTELPALTNLTWQAGFLIAAFVALLIIGPRLTSQNDRLRTPWFDAALKTATILIATAIAVAYIPNWVLQTSTVSGLPRAAQDLIGVSVWTLGLLACIAGLWYAHRESRV